jgi:hypothetical protein
MERLRSPVSFWLLWALGTAVIFAIAVALFNVFGLLSTAIIVLGFWQAWLLRRWVPIPIWQWWVITLGFGIAGFGCVIMLTLWLPVYGPLFTLRSLVIGAVMGAAIGLGQALLLRRHMANAYWWVLASAVAVALGGGWVIDLVVRQVFNLPVPYTGLISPIAQALLPTPGLVQSLCRYSEFSVPPPPNPLQSPNWIYNCRAVNVGIAFVSGLIGGGIKAGGLIWLMMKAEDRRRKINEF